MTRTVALLLAVGIAASLVQVETSFADGVSVVRPAKKARPQYRAHRCAHDRCGYPITCPDGTCSSLFGAYGPQGGFQYWSRYTYGGWGRGW